MTMNTPNELVTFFLGSIALKRMSHEDHPSASALLGHMDIIEGIILLRARPGMIMY